MFRIRGSHPRCPGSIPGVGTLFFFKAKAKYIGILNNDNNNNFSAVMNHVRSTGAEFKWLYVYRTWNIVLLRKQKCLVVRIHAGGYHNRVTTFIKSNCTFALRFQKGFELIT